ncbi:CLUMA_CG017484, isoform A [Clunio marinus]|uniref:CLUMA_CG017484, isoform A n=1 Tax=Clunio marinus TaxID=568069 RepID=A0A1J1IZ06_9DIPT|nr:CLUMA_CG017484, isoform A [Clunio marinus]
MSLVMCNIATSGNDNNNNSNIHHHNNDADKNTVTIYRCPIASLDCMEEFTGHSHIDYGHPFSYGTNPAIRPTPPPTPGLRYKNLGKSGLRVSNVGLGTWSIFSPMVSDEQAEAIIKLAADSGINLFDLSEAHSGVRAELELGRIIQKYNWKRTSYVITTKIYWSTKSEERGLSRKHIIESVKASLQRLQVDYIDIILVHKADAMCPMEEMIRAMNYVINQGWCLYWGTAKWSHVEIMEAYSNCRQFNCVTPIVEQAEYHMFCREKAELYLPELYNKIGVGLMAWGPLSMSLPENSERLLFSTKGSLRNKSQSYSWTEDELNKEDRMDESRRHCEKIRELAMLAEKLGCSTTQLSIAWSLKHEPVQCLLLGATTTEQLHMNLQALQLLPRMSVAVMMELERILENKPGPSSVISGIGMSGVAESPKDENLSLADSNKSKNSKKSEKSSLTNAKEFIRDYKSIPASTSTSFNNKDERAFGRGNSFGNDIEQKDSPTTEEKSKMKIKRNSSLISLKSINQNLKAMLKISRNDTSSSSDAEVGEATKLVKKTYNPPIAPCVRIDDVDSDDTKMLLNYRQSPQRYPSTSSICVTPAITPTTSSTTELLQYQEYVPRSASPSPYLSISISPRRSSTSDILNKKIPTANPNELSPKKSNQNVQSVHGSGTTLTVDPTVLNKERRPSTSELLRKARERKGSEGKLGRSISSGGSLARCGGNRNRRLSMAF